MGLAIFLFVIEIEGLRESGNDIWCTFVTFLGHYIWLTVFAWLSTAQRKVAFTKLSLFFVAFLSVLEGFQLYRLLIRIFDSGDHRQFPFYLFGYGAPATIVIVTVIAAVIIERDNPENHYHGEERCWLGSKYIWAFTGPVIFTMVFNVIVFIRAFSVTLQVISLNLNYF